MSNKYIFTSESVSEGHPDKVCDQISDVIVDLYLSYDKQARTAIEVLAAKDKVLIAGEVRSNFQISNEQIELAVRQKIKDIGYISGPFNADKVEVEIKLNKQSPDIAIGVDERNGKEEGAGDQGLMFGYATTETNALMPAPIYYSHKILKDISADIKDGKLKGLGPDAKSQVTLVYENGIPVRAHYILVSIQHHPDLSIAQIRDLIRPYVISAFPSLDWMCDEEHFLVNPTGRFIIGGPEGDTGLTGRKIIVDTYGGAAPHGGGAFSGKDPTKVDRSAAYMARYLAKNIVASRLATRCTIQIAYAIGIAKPMSFYVNTHNTGEIDDEVLTNKIPEIICLKPKSIRTYLGLNKPIYTKTAAYGHFGRTPDADGCFSWEKLDLINKIKGSL
ncbi:MAG: S-adenosylmethionine synthetase [Rickettsiaceae bacterium]|jgi:S-adenosylmethionine synthetase|nr:S-adenosylmethionine synthetase [Rickettsiaceae bacterium]